MESAAIVPNEFIAHFRITGKLGQGGMGVVYRATDTRLNREVAVKVLPATFANDNDRIARFHREATALATLNHSGIASIYGLEESDNGTSLILELVEGKTLFEQLEHGPIPLNECLPLFMQIAEALEAAHEKGIIHRDLKPSNIKLTETGRPKILDFGLAKSLPESNSTTSISDLKDSPTITDLHTRPGTILGTAAYMSPEQARAKNVDKRTDIWSFGCLFYECLTGQNPFRGQDATESLARVLEREPDWALLPPGTPPPILFLLKKCLAKDQKQRLHEIADARIDLEQVISEPPGKSPWHDLTEATTHHHKTNAIWTQGLPWSIAILAILIALFGRHAPETAVQTKTQLQSYSLNLKSGTSLSTMIGSSVVMSMDGSRFVYQAENDSTMELYWSAIGENEFHRIPQSENSSPTFAFSPDGNQLVFYSDGWVMLHSFKGGQPQKLVQSGLMGGVTWISDTQVVFANEHGIFQVDIRQQKKVTELLAANESEGEAGFACLSPLPDQRHILMGVLKSGSRLEVEVFDTETRNRKKIGLTRTLTAHFHASSGHLLFGRDDVLWARKFDPTELEFDGDEFLLVDDLGRDWMKMSHQFTMADNGTLIYARGHQTNPKFNAILATSSGTELILPIQSGDYQMPRISQDGTKALLIRNESSAVIVDLSSGQTSETEMPTGQFIIVKYDGDSLYYSKGTYADEEQPFYRKRFGDQKPDELLWQPQLLGSGVRAISADSNLYASVGRKLGEDENILIYDRQTKASAVPIRDGEHADFTPCFSPTDPWIAFCSTQSKQPEIYLSPLDQSELPVQVSKGGGSMPVWSPAGKRLYYRGGDKHSIVVIEIHSLNPLSVGSSQTIVNEGFRSSGILNGSSFDVGETPQGEQVIYLKSAYDEPDPQFATRLAVLVNFDDYIESKAIEASGH